MLSNKLRYRVDKIYDEVVDLNGFKYFKCGITVPGNIKMYGFINSQMSPIIEEGKYYSARKAYLTYIDGVEVDNSKDASFRIDTTTVSDESTYRSEEVTVVHINALVHKSKNNEIRYYGPMRTAYFCTTARMRNEVEEDFYIMLMGFHGKARALEKLNDLCYADITGILSRRKHKKPCYIVVKDVLVRKEVV